MLFYEVFLIFDFNLITHMNNYVKIGMLAY